MEAYKREFIEFMVEETRAETGDFCLEERPESPTLHERGRAYVTGSQLHLRLERFYTCRHPTTTSGLANRRVVFGPAYKGIPLSVISPMALSRSFTARRRVTAPNRRGRDHGITGILLNNLRDGDRVVIVEDVTGGQIPSRRRIPSSYSRQT